MLRIFGAALLFTFVHSGFAKIWIDKAEACEPNENYEVSVTQKIKEQDGMQVLEEGVMNSTITLDDNVMGAFQIYMLDGDEWNIFIVTRDPFCQIISKYMKDIAGDLEKAAGLTHTCPYPAREYKVTNFPLDFEKIDYRMVPRGQIRVVTFLFDANTEKTFSCQVLEFTVSD